MGFVIKLFWPITFSCCIRFRRNQNRWKALVVSFPTVLVASKTDTTRESYEPKQLQRFQNDFYFLTKIKFKINWFLILFTALLKTPPCMVGSALCRLSSSRITIPATPTASSRWWQRELSTRTGHRESEKSAPVLSWRVTQSQKYEALENIWEYEDEDKIKNKNIWEWEWE